MGFEMERGEGGHLGSRGEVLVVVCEVGAALGPCSWVEAGVFAGVRGVGEAEGAGEPGRGGLGGGEVSERGAGEAEWHCWVGGWWEWGGGGGGNLTLWRFDVRGGVIWSAFYMRRTWREWNVFMNTLCNRFSIDHATATPLPTSLTL